MKSVLDGFKTFVLQGNVISMAVGIIIGAAFGKIVDGFVHGVANPLIAMLVGAPNVDHLAIGPIQYGLVVTATINFLLIAAVVYFVFVLPTNRLVAKKKKELPAAPPTREEVLLEEIRDALLKQA